MTDAVRRHAMKCKNMKVWVASRRRCTVILDNFAGPDPTVVFTPEGGTGKRSEDDAGRF